MNFIIMAISPMSIFMMLLAIVPGVLMAIYAIYAEFEEPKVAPKNK